ncbi:MAG: PDZ domain-containing protein [Acidobacteriota bacterium]
MNRPKTKVLLTVLALLVTRPDVVAAGEPSDADGDANLTWTELADGHAKRGFLGVELLPIGTDLRRYFGAPEGRGILVSHVAEDSPARKAGLLAGDVITSVDNQPVENDWAFRRVIWGKKSGDALAIEVVRDRKTLSITATMEERERAEWNMGAMFGKEMLEGGKLRGLMAEGEIKKAVERAQKALESPELQEKLRRYHELESDLDRRTRDIERRLEELEKKLK